ncbi:MULTISPECIES: competence protein [Streptococcus]|jgi:hypothetical protein|uniref:Competence stimulating peptide n=1 Tax=Streptococcus sanguinis TaxID=1305 RepID=A0AAJ5TBM1_STRSA|nr:MULTISPECIES: competence protein [Streptococcus]MCY7023741.1 competence protein [Streptococcus sanguinis]MDQ8692947.1 competence protein [Streptococcus sp. IsoGale022]VDY73021.1 competence stimulating peptide [Streptococcus sanguinis]
MKIYSFQIAANSNSLVQIFWDLRGVPNPWDWIFGR